MQTTIQKQRPPLTPQQRGLLKIKQQKEAVRFVKELIKKDWYYRATSNPVSATKPIYNNLSLFNLRNLEEFIAPCSYKGVCDLIEFFTGPKATIYTK